MRKPGLGRQPTGSSPAFPYPGSLAIGLELQHIALALALAVAAYAIRELRRRRFEVRPKRPDYTVAEALARWRAGAVDHPDRRFLIGRAMPAKPAAAAWRDIGEELAEAAAMAASAEDHERQMIRRLVLAEATLALLVEAIEQCEEPARRALIRGYEEGMGELLAYAAARSRTKWAVLREYTRWKFDDAVPNDWFHHFLEHARPYIREKIRLARSSVLEADAGAGRFAEVYDKLLRELRNEALKVPPKKRFAPADLEP